MPDQANKLAKDLAELSIKQTLALVKSHYSDIEPVLVGEGVGEDCSTEHFVELFEEVTPVPEAICKDLDL